MSNPPTATHPSALHEDASQRTSLGKKLTWRILPILFICYVFSYIDRANIGMAQLQMKQTLPFSDLSYSIGASLFFVGYLLFEVPSNLMLQKSGARKTLIRILICWGAASAGMMFVRSEATFYGLRFLVGAFEAGFFPGVVLYLTYWFPSQRRGSIISAFLMAPSVALIAMPPAAGAIMRGMNGVAGLHGWQWLFVLSGVPASLLSIVVYFFLVDRPEQAKWLTAAEKAALAHELDTERKFVSNANHGSYGAMLRDPKIYALSLVYFLFIGSVYAMLFWMPSLVRSWGIADLFWVGIYSALPSVCGIVGMGLIGRSSDRLGERRWHFALATVLAGLGLAVTAVVKGTFVPSLIGLCVMMVGVMALTPLFFTIVSEYLPKKTAAAGIALVSSLGNLGAASMPPAVIWVNGKTGGPYTSLMLLTATFVLSGIVLLVAVRRNR
ncbi:MFS transporter [Trinickia dinghuensis]|uniref:MFS transporter n=1 Tax=Trinickia dinghuensis TaxID=2291023 RepID=A0A3D8JZD5_9BURK|nr:MFS transporter [Trinickia dinghuensis]RDU97984.1 MFS transporter [Trinickia dinghuensis]